MIDYNKYLNKHIREIGLSPIEKISLMAAEVKDCIVRKSGSPTPSTIQSFTSAAIREIFSIGDRPISLICLLRYLL